MAKGLKQNNLNMHLNSFIRVWVIYNKCMCLNWTIWTHFEIFITVITVKIIILSKFGFISFYSFILYFLFVSLFPGKHWFPGGFPCGLGWMHETGARAWCTGKTQRNQVEREVGGGGGMGNTCKSMADSCQCMTKTTTIL